MKERFSWLHSVAHGAGVDFARMALMHKGLQIVGFSQCRSDRMRASMARETRHIAMPARFTKELPRFLEIKSRALMATSTAGLVNPRRTGWIADSLHAAMAICASDIVRKMDIALALRADTWMARIATLVQI